MIIKSLREKNTPELLLVRFITSLCCCASLFILMTPGISVSGTQYARAVPLSRYITIFLSVYFILTALSLHIRADFYALAGSVGVYGLLVYRQNVNFYTFLGITAVFAIVIFYLTRGDKLSLPAIRLSPRAVRLIIAALSVCFVIYVGGLTLLRYLSYSSPCFDFGIFSQMFENMRRTLLPMVTCERDGLLSHFAVHISPIYYLLLPFYALIPTPGTLLVMQAVMLASGVIPLYLIARRFILSEWVTLGLCAALLCFPAVIGGCFYDLHENKFLLPLLLWLFYFIEKRNIPLIYTFAALVMAVKEDAPMYVFFAALYMILNHKRFGAERQDAGRFGADLTAGQNPIAADAADEKSSAVYLRHGIALMFLALAYFMIAVHLLDSYGDGAMMWRYDNITGGGGLSEIARVALVNPAKIITELLSEDKLAFISYIFLPLGFLPLITRRLSDYILLCPMIIMNLITSYVYQYDINFQYTYGVSAILFYLAAKNLAAPGVGKLKISRMLPLALSAAVLLGVGQYTQRQSASLTRYINNREDIDQITESLEAIPAGASVSASTMFIAKLRSHAELYVIDTKHEAEYIVLDLRPYVNVREKYGINHYLLNGYELIENHENIIAVLKKGGGNFGEFQQ